MNLERVVAFKDKYSNMTVDPSDDITSYLIRETIGFSSPCLNNTVEFNDLKNHLILFYEEQKKRSRDLTYQIPNYHVLNVVMLSLRQLIIELLKETGIREQMKY